MREREGKSKEREGKRIVHVTHTEAYNKSVLRWVTFTIALSGFIAQVARYFWTILE